MVWSDYGFGFNDINKMIGDIFMYSALEMLYATHVIEGKRTIESVPTSIRENVAEIVNDAKKPEKTN